MIYRNYQIDTIQEVSEKLLKGERKSVMIKSPTGSGKSVIIAGIIQRFLNEGKSVLFVVDRKILVRQIFQTLAKNGINAGIIMSGHVPSYQFKVQVASIQTLNKRRLPVADLIIIDEAHATQSQSYKKVMANYPDAFKVGLTATPYRLSGEGFSDIFDELYVTTTLRTQIEEGWLVDMKYLVSSIPNFNEVRVQNGEYNPADNKRVIETAPIIKTYKDEAYGKKGIVFCVDIEHSKSIANLYVQNGIKAEHVDSYMPDDVRESIVKRYINNEIDILTNVELFTTGFDVPHIEFVQLLRMSKSLSLFLQMVGRGTRVLPNIYSQTSTKEERIEAIKNSAKKELLILDHAGMFFEHGHPITDFDWQYYFSRKKKDKVKKEKEEQFLMGIDTEGKVRLTTRMVELEGCKLVPITKELQTLVVFESFLKDVLKRSQKIARAIFLYRDYLIEQKILFTDELYQYVLNKVQKANGQVELGQGVNLFFLKKTKDDVNNLLTSEYAHLFLNPQKKDENTVYTQS